MTEKLNQHGLTTAEWDRVVAFGCQLHDDLMNEPEGADWYDGQSNSIMQSLVKVFKAGKAVGGNYVVDAATYPKSVTFANGRTVTVKTSFDGLSPYLDISAPSEVTHDR